jgi:hypothetical protein
MFDLDPSPAAAVGDWYLNAPVRPHDAGVEAAYRQLQSETDRLFGQLVCFDGPGSVRVVFTRCRQPYGSDRDLVAAVRAEGVLEITTAALSAEPLHPLLGCELGGPFDRFRALHDLIGHAGLGYGFDLDGEWAAWLAQDRLHSGLARLALATELFGVNCARWVAGEAPELKAMVFDPHLQCQGSDLGDDQRERWKRSAPAPA